MSKQTTQSFTYDPNAPRFRMIHCPLAESGLVGVYSNRYGDEWAIPLIRSFVGISGLVRGEMPTQNITITVTNPEVEEKT